jgi:hypothetical protein
VHANAHLDGQVGVEEVRVRRQVAGGPAGGCALPLVVACRRNSLQVCIRAVAGSAQSARCARRVGGRHQSKHKLRSREQRLASKGMRPYQRRGQHATKPSPTWVVGVVDPRPLALLRRLRGVAAGHVADAAQVSVQEG